MSSPPHLPRSRRRSRAALALESSVDLRTLIVEVATVRFAEVGFHGCSMRDIAAELRVTPTAIYHHYKDKESLYLEVLRLTFTTRAGSLERALTSQQSPEKRILAFTEGLVQLLEGDRVYLKLLQRELMERSIEEVASLSTIAFVTQLKKLAQLIEALFPDRNAHRLSFNIYALALGYAQMLPVRMALPSEIAVGDTPAAVARLIVLSILPGISLSSTSTPS